MSNEYTCLGKLLEWVKLPGTVGLKTAKCVGFTLDSNPVMDNGEVWDRSNCCYPSRPATPIEEVEAGTWKSLEYQLCSLNESIYEAPRYRILAVRAGECKVSKLGIPSGYLGETLKWRPSIERPINTSSRCIGFTLDNRCIMENGEIWGITECFRSDGWFPLTEVFNGDN